MLNEVPGAFLFMFVSPEDVRSCNRSDANHSPEVLFDDAHLPDQAAALAALSLGNERCARLSPGLRRTGLRYTGLRWLARGQIRRCRRPRRQSRTWSSRMSHLVHAGQFHQGRDKEKYQGRSALELHVDLDHLHSVLRFEAFGVEERVRIPHVSGHGEDIAEENPGPILIGDAQQLAVRVVGDTARSGER